MPASPIVYVNASSCRTSRTSRSVNTKHTRPIASHAAWSCAMLMLPRSSMSR